MWHIEIASRRASLASIHTTSQNGADPRVRPSDQSDYSDFKLNLNRKLTALKEAESYIDRVPPSDNLDESFHLEVPPTDEHEDVSTTLTLHDVEACGHTRIDTVSQDDAEKPLEWYGDTEVLDGFDAC